MRKTIYCSLFVLVLSIAAVSEAKAQSRPVLGGYKEIAKTDAAVKKAAIFAVGSEAKRAEKEIEFISVIKAERQIVGGTNYRMCLKVNDGGAEGQDAAEVFVKAIVNVDLKGVYKLLSWEASDCGEDEEEG